MGRGYPTVDAPPSSDPRRNPIPAAIGVFVASRPAFRLLPLAAGATILGRLTDPDLPEDDQSSRSHAEVTLHGATVAIRDLGSRNGTYVNGERCSEARVELPCVVRVGCTVFVIVADSRGLHGGVTMDERGVVGPTFRAALARVERAARTGDTLLISGETGTGKERAARVFHDAGPARRGELLAVNCATIPHGLAERLLFGAVKGAYSGADAPAEGYVAAADRGTLFLDEIGELDPLVQPKLLRVLETREVLPLGAARPIKVTTRFCFATMQRLRAAVKEGRFRADLFYRIARDEIELPALRDRREEIPWLVSFAVARVAPELTPHARLIEACLLRPWPGNVRELLSAVERAVAIAREEGKGSVRDGHLDAAAGVTEAPAKASRKLTREVIEQAIADHDGNLSAAARHLGLHRSQFYRLLSQLGIERRGAD